MIRKQTAVVRVFDPVHVIHKLWFRPTRTEKIISMKLIISLIPVVSKTMSCGWNTAKRFEKS